MKRKEYKHHNQQMMFLEYGILEHLAYIGNLENKNKHKIVGR